MSKRLVRLLPIIAVGLANIPIWYVLVIRYGFRWYLVCLLAAVAFMAGCLAVERTWATAGLLVIPTLFLGSTRHGRPVDWIAGGILDLPALPLALYVLILNVGPIFLSYWLVVWFGSRVTRWVTNRR